ncbi:hypothetical protein ACH5RR_003312 [Cinchona calisaya]|uniref:Uncharacterized protein n=1 Tax=Cinchona calisaya TaxID=153742 RepID=A0ABD3AUH2_9GENT
MSLFELLDALKVIPVPADSPVYYRIGDGNDLYDFNFEFFLDRDDLNDGCDPVNEEEVAKGVCPKVNIPNYDKYVQLINDEYDAYVESKGKGKIAEEDSVSDDEVLHDAYNLSDQEIKSIKGLPHMCPWSYQNKSANSRWLSKIFVEEIADHPFLNVGEFTKDIKKKFMLLASTSQVYRAKNIVVEAIQRNYSKQYERLRDYYSTILGSVAIVLTERELPVLTMFETIRRQIMCRFHEKNEWEKKLMSKICPRIVQKVEEKLNDVIHCDALVAGSGVYEGIIMPIPDQSQWVNNKSDLIAHSRLKIVPGMPKKVRRKGLDEDLHSGRVTKRGIPIHCSHCGHTDHNVPTTNMQTEQEAPPRGAARGDTHTGRPTRGGGASTVAKGMGKDTGGAANNGPLCGIGLWYGVGISNSKTYFPLEDPIATHPLVAKLWTTSKQTTLEPAENPVGDTSNSLATAFDDNPTSTTTLKKTGARKKRSVVATGTWQAIPEVSGTSVVKTKYNKFGDAMFSTQSLATGASDVVQTPKCVLH